MANCVVTTASLSDSTACETIIEAVDEDKFLDKFKADGIFFVVAKT